MLARLRLTERLLLLLAFFLFFFSASEEELLEEDPARAGPVGSAAPASVSAGLATSTLFLGAAAAAVAPASAVGLPTRYVSNCGGSSRTGSPKKNARDATRREKVKSQNLPSLVFSSL